MKTLFATFLAACLAVPTLAQAKTPSKTYHSASAGEIADSPDKWYGKNVTVRAEVEKVKDQYTFLLDEEELFAAPDVMVIVPKPLAKVPEGHPMRVTGKVVKYTRAEMEKEYEWFKPDYIEIELHPRPVIIAESVMTDSGVEYVKGADLNAMLMVPAGEISRNPPQFVNRAVSVRAEVEDIIDTNLLQLDEDIAGVGPDLVAIVPHFKGIIDEGNGVTVAGTVVRMDEAKFKKQFPHIKWTDDVKDAITEHPVIVADSVRYKGQEMVMRRSKKRNGEATLTMIVMTQDKNALNGDVFHIDAVKVEKVLSDRTFIVRNDRGDKIPVVIAETITPGNAKVDKGDWVELRGVVLGAPTTYQDGELERDAFNTVKKHGAYLHATRVNVYGES